MIQVFGGTVSNGRLELLEAGSTTNQAQGGSGVQLNGKVPTPTGGAAIRVQNTGEAAVVSPTLTVLLP